MNSCSPYALFDVVPLNGLLTVLVKEYSKTFNLTELFNLLSCRRFRESYLIYENLTCAPEKLPTACCDRIWVTRTRVPSCSSGGEESDVSSIAVT
jgi:hypothetical protein